MSTQFVIPVCLLLAAVCVRAQNDVAPESGDEAPADIEDAPQDGPPPVTPAPPTPPGEENKNLYCYGTQAKADELCRKNADNDATCTLDTGSCVCSSGFGPYVDPAGFVFSGCFSDATDHNEPVERTQVGTFAGGDFNSFTPDLRETFEGAWESTTKKNISSSFYSKGSINYVFTFNASNAEMGSIVAAKGQLIENVKNDPLLNTVMKPETLTVATISAGPEECVAANAARAFLVESVCQARECNDGYYLYISVTGTQICTSQSRDLDEDDDLTDGEIAGIVVAAVLFTAVIVGGIIYVFMTNKSTHPDVEEPRKESAPIPQPMHPHEPAASPPGAAASGNIYASPYGEMETDPQTPATLALAKQDSQV